MFGKASGESANRVDEAAKNKIELAILGTASVASALKVDEAADRVCNYLESVDEGEGEEKKRMPSPRLMTGSDSQK